MNTYPSRITAILAILGCITIARADVTFMDSEFDDSEWERIVLLHGNGGSVTSTQACPGGNPGCFRRVTVSVNAAPGPKARSSVLAFHRHIGSVYHPAIQGAITSIDYSEDARMFDQQEMVLGLALRQAGELYLWYYVESGNSWTPSVRRDGLRATNFWRIDIARQPTYLDAARYPDFSSSAPPIEFGFIAAASTGENAGATGGSGGIDNWHVTVRTGTHLTIRCSEVEVCWNSRTNQTYQLQYRSDLTTNQWTDLGIPIPGNGSTNCFRDAVTTHERRFYRTIEWP